jgi:hypothetical protein
MDNTEIIAIRQALTGIQVELIRIANGLDRITDCIETQELRTGDKQNALRYIRAG